MRPMSLFESGHSDGSVSLLGLFAGESFHGHVDISIFDIAGLVCRGGWPASTTRSLVAARVMASQYLESVFRDNAPKMGRSSQMARRIFTSLARNDTKSSTVPTIASDCAGGEESDPASRPARSTIEAYLEFFKDIYLIEELPGWSEGARSKKRVRSKPKRYIVDPSLTAAQLGLDDAGLLRDMQTLGNLFESLCIRDLRVYLASRPEFQGSRLYYYADDSGCEVDAVIELADGRWGALEIKLSEDKVEEGEKNLLAMRDKISRNAAARVPSPSFLGVVVGRTSGAHRTAGGVQVIPVSALGA